MPSINAVRAALPPFMNERIKITQRQGADDIENEILATHKDCETDYDKIYRLFDLGDIDDTAKGLWEFLKYNLVYKAESGDDQSVKSPGAILHKGGTVDCKHYSLFIGGVLDAIKANEGDTWDWCYRFVSETKDPTPTHVFVVVNDGDRELWIDPVLEAYNRRKNYTHITDLKPMALYRINGPQDGEEIQDVDKETAAVSFLTMVNLNLYDIKTLMRKYPAILNGPVQQWYNANGLDFNQLVNFLNS